MSVVIEESPIFRANLEMSIEIYNCVVARIKMLCLTYDMKRILTVYMLLVNATNIKILKCPVASKYIKTARFMRQPQPVNQTAGLLL
jgi:hypothetical protein